MTPEELRTEIEAGRIDTVVMAFPDHYGRLMGKRFDGQFFLDSGLADGTHACDYLFTVDMEMNPVERVRVRQLGARVRRLPHGARPVHDPARAPGPTARRW